MPCCRGARGGAEPRERSGGRGRREPRERRGAWLWRVERYSPAAVRLQGSSFMRSFSSASRAALASSMERNRCTPRTMGNGPVSWREDSHSARIARASANHHGPSTGPSMRVTRVTSRHKTLTSVQMKFTGSPCPGSGLELEPREVLRTQMQQHLGGDDLAKHRILDAPVRFGASMACFPPVAASRDLPCGFGIRRGERRPRPQQAQHDRQATSSRLSTLRRARAPLVPRRDGRSRVRPALRGALSHASLFPPSPARRAHVPCQSDSETFCSLSTPNPPPMHGLIVLYHRTSASSTSYEHEEEMSNAYLRLKRDVICTVGVRLEASLRAAPSSVWYRGRRHTRVCSIVPGATPGCVDNVSAQAVHVGNTEAVEPSSSRCSTPTMRVARAALPAPRRDQEHQEKRSIQKPGPREMRRITTPTNLSMVNSEDHQDDGEEICERKDRLCAVPPVERQERQEHQGARHGHTERHDCILLSQLPRRGRHENPLKPHLRDDEEALEPEPISNGEIPVDDMGDAAEREARHTDAPDEIERREEPRRARGHTVCPSIERIDRKPPRPRLDIGTKTHAPAIESTRRVGS